MTTPAPSPVEASPLPRGVVREVLSAGRLGSFYVVQLAWLWREAYAWEPADKAWGAILDVVRLSRGDGEPFFGIFQLGALYTKPSGGRLTLRSGQPGWVQRRRLRVFPRSGRWLFTRSVDQEVLAALPPERPIPAASEPVARHEARRALAMLERIGAALPARRDCAETLGLAGAVGMEAWTAGRARRRARGCPDAI